MQRKYLVRVLSSLPDANRILKRTEPLGTSSRRLSVKGVSTRYGCICMKYSERIHVLLGRTHADEAATVCAFLADFRGPVERIQL